MLSNENIPVSKNIEIDLRERLANLGLNEIKSFTFISPKKIIPESDFNDNLQIINPISNESKYNEKFIISKFIRCSFKNYAKGFDAFSLFEIGDVFKDKEGFNQQKVSRINY